MNVTESVDTAAESVTPLRQTWQRLMRSAGPHAAALRRSIAGLGLAAALQGLALACMAPLFVALLPEAGDMPSRVASSAAGSAADARWRQALPWLWALTALGLAAHVLRWRAQGFDYTGQMAEVGHRLRLRLGEQLRRMPLLQLQDKRTGEVNAVVLGNVDEHLNHALIVFNLLAQAVITPLAAGLALLAWDWRLGLAMLLVFPALAPLYRWRRRAYARGMRALAQANARCSGDVLEYTQGLPVLRAARSAGARAAHLQQSFARLEQL